MSNFVKKLRSLSAAPPVMQDGEHETQTSESSFESDEEVSLPGGESETKEKEEKEQQLRARRPSALEERREASKKKELAAFYEKFNLPETEPIVNTYSAAFMKQGLVMHGRLYMTLHHLCFYSSLFNNKSVEKIKIEDIVEFKKTFKNLTYGIQVIANDQKFNFVSFFHRDRAFVLLTKLVEDHKNNTTSIENHVETSTLVPETNGGEEGNADDDMIEDSLLEMDSAGPSEGFLNATGEMNQLVSTSFPLPVIKFFKLFFSDDSKDFTQLYHKERGDTDTVIKTWSQNAQFGNVREIQYRAPVKAPIGPNSTRCDETQRYHLTKNRLLIETVGIYYDVPFGDTFRVEGKWEITSDVNNQRQCNVVVSVSLYWIKKTWFKSKIEAGTLKETKESYELWVKLANQHLKSSSARSTLLEKTIDLDATSISSSISSASSFPSSPSPSSKTSTKTKVSIPWTRPIIFASFGVLLVVLSFLGLWASVSIVFLAITGCLVYLAVSLERQILNLERRVVHLEQNQSNKQENHLHSPHEHSE